MEPIKNIKQSIKKLTVDSSDEIHSRVLDKLLKVLDKSKKQTAVKQPSIGRIIMKSRITKLAVAAVIIIAAVVGIHNFGGSIDGASVAWGNLAERVIQIRTYISRGHISVTSGPLKEKTRETEVEVFGSSEYGFRANIYTDGKLETTQYALFADKVIIHTLPAQKKYMRMILTDEHLRKMQQQGSDPREMVKQFMSVEYTELGRDTIDGIEVEGIETTDAKVFGGQFENYVGRLWVDVETDLPVRMEMEMQSDISPGTEPMQVSMVMDGYEWDVELDPTIFEPNIPEDYTLMAEVQMPIQNEGSAVQGLRLFAEISDGNYPNTMVMMKIARIIKLNFDKKGIEDDPNNKLSQEERDEMRKEVIEKTMTIGGACMFYAELVKQDKDPAYYGDIVTFDDVNMVLMRWKISDGQYRVIFGDLTTENVSAEELAELERQLP